MTENDYIMRLIKSATQLAASILTGKNHMDSPAEEIHNINISKDDMLTLMVNKYINDGKINEAEDMIFDAIEEHKSPEILQTAIFFYQQLSTWSDEKLTAYNFSRREIMQGLEEVKRLYEN